MSESRQQRRARERVRQESARESVKPFLRLPFLFLGIVAGALLGSTITLAIGFSIRKNQVSPTVQRVSVEHKGLTLGRLMEMTPEQLSGVDIAEANLLCAQDLPGTEKVDIGAALKTLDQWADHVDMETRRNWHRFKDNPEECHNSEAEFRMGMMITVLQQDYGLRYNPDLIPFSQPGQHGPAVDRAFLTNPGNMFLTEILLHRTGTCASMPVLYTAIGRRLGYPVKLSNAKEHLFVRWDSGNGTGYVDIEGTGRGFNIRTDADFKKWPDAITDQEIKSGQYLSSLTPAQELSAFLATRGGALLYHQRFTDALVTFADAIRLWPQGSECHAYLAYAAHQVAPEEIRSTPFETDPAFLHDPRHMDPRQELEMLNRINQLSGR